MTAEQLSLLETPEFRVSGLLASLKAAMNRAASGHRLSRDQMVDAMNRIADSSGVRLGGNAKLTAATLEKWLNPADREHIPSLFGLSAFCLALEDSTPMAALAGVLGCGLMSAEDLRDRDYGRACRLEREARRRKRRLEDEL